MDGTFFAIGTVISQDPDNGAVKVALRSAQVPPLSVSMLYHGFCDPLRVAQAPLPQRGTAGIVIFPQGDIRSGYWLGAFFPNLQDAITTDAADPAGKLDYYAHWSGFWRILDMNGTTAAQWPDGSYLVVGSGTTLPKVFRHTVNGQQQRQRIEYTMADRVSGQVNPFSVFWQQAASGMTFALDASGHATITGGPQGSFTLNYASGSTLTLDSSGGIQVKNKAGATVTLDTSGNLGIMVPAGKTISLTDGGSAGDAVPLVSLLTQAFNTHTHTGVQGGAGTTGTPTTPLTAAAIQSKVVKVQE